jgi:hypothetical protein
MTGEPSAALLAELRAASDKVLIDVVDRTANDSFDGFSLINAGGDWTLHEVIVEDRG